MTVGTYIKCLREARGWSLHDLSLNSVTGISKSHLSNIENDVADPSLTVLDSIAGAFGMGAGDLLTQAGYTVNAPAVATVTATVRVTMANGVWTTEVIE